MKGLLQEEVYKLMDDLNIVDASCLIAGVSPTQCYLDEYNSWCLNIYNTDPDNAREVFNISMTALCNAIKRGKLEAFVVVVHDARYITKASISNEWLLTHDLDVERTIINKSDLTQWLKQRGVFPSIFFPQGKIADLSNSSHPLYSSKLHAVVSAWESLFTADIQSTTVKKYLVDWLEKNSESYGLTISSKAKFEEIAEIANFDKRGVTVTGNPLYHFGGDEYKENKKNNNQTLNKNITSVIPENVNINLDDDLPF